MKVAIMGASGYLGGELARLLLDHPAVDLTQVTSSRLAGRPLHEVHPNLRGRSDLSYVPHHRLAPCDLLFLATPHGTSGEKLPALAALVPRIIDLSADFRLRSPEQYETYYGRPHPHPEWLSRFTPGVPEIHRQALRDASHVAMPGCMANAGILALHPLAAEGWIGGRVVVDARTGSSGSGRDPSPANHHAERSGVMRVFRPAGHRHQAEISQACGVDVLMTATGVEAVRGVQVLAHVPLAREVEEREVWSLYRSHYGDEPFARLVKQRRGWYRLPEPKILAGTNYCDLGFALAADHRHLTVIAALDNLVKGGSGNAVQCLNLIAGWEERQGLGFPGLHPI